MAALAASAAAAEHRRLQVACTADFDGSGAVDVDDLLWVLAAFGNNAAGDTDGDGATNVADLLNLLSQFGNACIGTAPRPRPCAVLRSSRRTLVGFFSTCVFATHP